MLCIRLAPGAAVFGVVVRRRAAAVLLLLLLLLLDGRRRSVVTRSHGRERRVSGRHRGSGHQSRTDAASHRPVLAAASSVLQLGLELVLSHLGAVARLTLVLNCCNVIARGVVSPVTWQQPNKRS